ncbi:MAG: ChbG/HpnK family deacetylase [Pseudomonadota bacterium]
MKHFIINCDDLGMHPSIDRAATDLLSTGRASSASILATGPSFDHAVQKLKQFKIAEVGIHLCITAEYSKASNRPISPRGSIPSLLRPDGNFYPDVVEELKTQLNLSELKQELVAQIEKVKGTGLQLDHIDGHMFFYELCGPKVMDLVSVLAQSYKLPLRNRALNLKHHPSQFFFVWEDCAQRPARFEFYKQVFSSAEDFFSELIIHPGDSLEEMSEFTTLARLRLDDYDFFRSDDFLEIRQQIKMASWRDVKKTLAV